MKCIQLFRVLRVSNLILFTREFAFTRGSGPLIPHTRPRSLPPLGYLPDYLPLSLLPSSSPPCYLITWHPSLPSLHLEFLPVLYTPFSSPVFLPPPFRFSFPLSFFLSSFLFPLSLLSDVPFFFLSLVTSRSILPFLSSVFTPPYRLYFLLLFLSFLSPFPSLLPFLLIICLSN